MQQKTSGIVLHSLKYNDTSSIITIYTRDFGRTSYMVYGVGKKKSAIRSSFIQPLTLIELDVKHIPGKDLQQIREMRVLYPFSGIPLNPVKNALALFLSEVLFRALRQNEPDEALYLYLENSIQQLDCIESAVQNFHLVFLLKLSRYIGFEPNREEEGRFFDLLNGVFTREKPGHIHYLNAEVTAYFLQLIGTDFNSMDKVILSREGRTELLKGLLEYYRLHIPEFHQLQSLAVMQSLFD